MNAQAAINWFEQVLTAEGYSPETIRGYLYCLKRWTNYAGDPDVESITRKDLRQFFLYLQTETDLADGSKQKIWISLRSFFKFLKEEGILTERPDNIPMPKGGQKEIIPFTQEEVKKLIAACDYMTISATEDREARRARRSTGIRDKAMILVLLDTGLRVSELCRVRKKDMDLQRGLIQVVPYKSGVKSRARQVRIGKGTLKLVLRYLATRDDFEAPGSPLFTTRDHVAVTRDSVRQLLARLGKTAGVNNVHPHRFRHTFAIQFLRNGGDVFSLRDLLGHATLDMVQNYLHISHSDTENAHRTAGPVDNWKL